MSELQTALKQTQDLAEKKLSLLKQLGMSTRIQELWPDAFKHGSVFERSTSNKQFAKRWLEDTQGNIFPLTQAQYKYIQTGE